MDIIRNNPYRVLGLLAEASTREVTRQTTNLKKYLAADAELPSDYSFAALDDFRRTATDIDTAASRLNLDDDKMLAALFWFWKGNEITDEPAFDALKTGNINTAYQIWDKLIIGTKEDGKRFWKTVTAKNFSAFHNYAVLTMITDKEHLITAIVINIRFIESDYFAEFVNATVDATYKVSKRDIEMKFLETLMSGNISTAQLVKYLKEYNFAAKQDFLKSVSQKFTANINAQIETARKTRTTNKQQAAAAGETLYKNSKDDLAQLNEIFGTADFSYSNVADKVANEILQCSIDFFNDSQDKELDNDYHEKAINLVKMAQGIAVGSLMKNKAKDNLQTLEEMKEKEIQAAIAAMQMIKSLYEDNERKIRQQVKTLEVTDFEIIMGIKSINWSAVNENIKNSIAWEKVNELLRKILSDKNIDKIKNCTNSNQKEKFVQLAEWIKSHTTSKSVINNALNRYYGRTTQTTNSSSSTSNRTTPTYSSSSSSSNTGSYNAGGLPPMPNNYLVWAILATIFCCWPLGIPAIVKSAKVSSLYNAGDYAGAQRASANAKKCTIAATIVGGVVAILYCIVLGLAKAGIN